MEGDRNINTTKDIQCYNCNHRTVCTYQEKLRTVEKELRETLKKLDNPKGSIDFIKESRMATCLYYQSERQVR